MPNESVERRFDTIAEGDEAQFACTITSELVAQFAALSGDFNPLHMDEAYARTTAFKERIAHGAIAEALFSRLVGMHLPGRYALYLSQTLQFKRPILLGTEALVRGIVRQKSAAAKTLTIETTLCDASGTVLVSGEALVSVSA